jgi:hypothetical protein
MKMICTYNKSKSIFQMYVSYVSKRPKAFLDISLASAIGETTKINTTTAHH